MRYAIVMVMVARVAWADCEREAADDAQARASYERATASDDEAALAKATPLRIAMDKAKKALDACHALNCKAEQAAYERARADTPIHGIGSRGQAQQVEDDAEAALVKCKAAAIPDASPAEAERIVYSSALCILLRGEVGDLSKQASAKAKQLTRFSRKRQAAIRREMRAKGFGPIACDDPLMGCALKLATPGVTDIDCEAKLMRYTKRVDALLDEGLPKL